MEKKRFSDFNVRQIGVDLATQPDYSAIEMRVVSHIMDEVLVMPDMKTGTPPAVTTDEVIKRIQDMWASMPSPSQVWPYGQHMPIPSKHSREEMLRDFGEANMAQMEARGFDSNGMLLPHRKIWLMAAGLSPDECDELQPYLRQAGERDRVYQLKQGFARPALMGKRKNKHRRGGPPTPPPSLIRFVVGKHLSANVRTNARVIYDGRTGTFNEEFEAWPT